MFLVGEHISHSLSPAMWNHLFRTLGIDVRYDRRDVDAARLGMVETEIREGGVLAANVTMPHKAWAAEIADVRSDHVTVTGAANFLVPTDGVVTADNTDVTGARAVLEPLAPYGRVLVLGAGGTAGALLRSLVGLAGEVTVTNRTTTRAEELATRFGGDFASIEVVEWADREEGAARYDLIVSTVPALDSSPVDPGVLGSDARVYDVVYRSEPTAFQRAVAGRGLPLADGLAHLAAQAIAMLEPLGFDADGASLLVAGLEEATGRAVTAWGGRLS